MNHDQLARDYSPRDPYADQLAAKQARNAYAGAILGTSAGPVPQVRARSSIEEQLERISMSVTAMEEQLERLMDRLAVVTAARPEVNMATEKTRELYVRSPLADQAARIAAHVERLNQALSHLTDGVDL